ncbi:MAG TPA: sigma 54-interacting transcriptional regulator, partial [Vicinamibacterales bacterium]|nr:sigma 54-interacting transcriptional regulator [Vicinamibacterales bacterium]
MVLSDLAPAVRQIADVEAFGAVLWRPDSQAQLVTRHRAGVAGHLLAVADLPSMLAPRPEPATSMMAVPGSLDPAHPLVTRLAGYGIESLLVIPVPRDLGFWWAGLRGAAGFSAAQIAALERLVADTAAAQSAGIEPPEVRFARLEAIDRIDAMLPVIADTLDIRTIFHRLSEVARSVLPHDAAAVQLLEDDTRARIYALDGIAGTETDEPVWTRYAPLFNRTFQFAIHDDLLMNPAERDRPAAKSGMRSSIRLPLRLDGVIAGAIEFSAAQIGVYKETDFGIASRIAEYVKLTIAHQRMADAARRAAALRARTDHLLALDDLLAALSGVLDLRDVFDRVAEIAKQVLTHDAIAITTVFEDEGRLRIHAISGFTDDFPAFVDAPLPEPALLTEPWDYRLIDDLAADARYARSPTAAAGMRSALGFPIRFDGRLKHGVNFYSRRPRAFTPDDVLVGRRLAEHLALALSHKRLADAAQDSSQLQAAEAKLELIDELLMTLNDSAEVSEMFDRISEISRQVVPHDGLMLAVVLPDGERAKRYADAGWGANEPATILPLPEPLRKPDFEFEIIDDLTERTELHNVMTFERGFRSTLRVPILLDGRLAAGLVFASRAPAAYTRRDAFIARRIGDRIALCLRRERGLAEAMRADEADARAAQLEARVTALTEELDARTGYRRVVGASASWKQVLTQATQVAATDTTVLLLGESGTGKEVVARFVHRASARAKGPFVALNCAALPEQLLEAELFGYERGAFTGAAQSKPGQLEQAAGGTLFLDEVGEMSPQVQAKFLRVLQEKEFQRLGGTRVLKTDARVVAATNRDLPQAIAQGRFREDLYYRLHVFAIPLPPLRERRDDILPLSEAFLTEYGRGLGHPPAGISKDARTRLIGYHWPGNVRELRNTLERAAILCDGGLITAEHLALTAAPVPVVSPAGAIEVRRPEREASAAAAGP